MVGLIWMVQVVHYPLFSAVGTSAFRSYEDGHTRRIGALLAVPASIEIVTAALIAATRPDSVSVLLALSAGAILASIWIMTGLVQASLHQVLARGFDPSAHRRLVRTNWWRTAAWTVRGTLAAVMLT
jgi:hypothetical protein